MSGSRYQPGISEDGDSLRFDVAEILRSKGIEPTPAAIEQAARMLAKACADLKLPVKIS